MSNTLYRKYRPKDFSDVLGQKHITKTLENALTSDRIAHAYLFTGPRGTGKTTVARIFATAINTVKRKGFEPVDKEVAKRLHDGNSMDVIEIDAASSTSVEGIRTLKETVNITPSEAKFKVYIVDEVHMLSTSAFNALLKTLEEPPAHVIFILATTEIHKVPETILSRCQRFDFARFTIEDIVKKLGKIAKDEKVKISDEALEMIAIASDGGMRDAESLFAQVLALEDKTVTAEEVGLILGTTSSQEIIDLLDAYTKKDIAQSLKIISSVVHNGYNMETFIKTVIEKLRVLLYVSLNNDTEKDIQKLVAIPQSEIDTLQSTAKNTTYDQIIYMIEECTVALQKTKSTTIVQLPIEVASVNICGSTQKKNPTTDTAEKEVSAPQKEKSSQKNPPQESPKKTVTEKIVPQSEKWKESVVQIEKEHKSVGQVLLASQIIESKGEVQIITTTAFYQEKLLEANNRSLIEKTLTNVYETPIKISIVVERKNKKPASEILNYATQIMGGAVTES